MAEANEQTWRVDAARGPLAFIADVHGNLAALDATLDALDTAGASAIFVAGDLVLQGSEPLAVWKRLQDVGARCVRGTSDRALSTIDPNTLRAKSPSEVSALTHFKQTREALGELILARLRRLPEALRLELPDGTEWIVVHGSPRDPDEALTADLSDDELLAALGGDPADLVICGAGHVPFVRALDDVTVVCVGSVGAAPEGRVAHYTLITPADEAPTIYQSWVEY